MENIRPKQEETMVKKLAPKKATRYSQSKEYDTFINILTSVVGSLKRYADREEMVVVDIYEDAGKSGKSIEGRPAFKKMLLDIENGLQIDYILVYKLSRFGRNASDILKSLEFIQSYGINLICIEEGIGFISSKWKTIILLHAIIQLMFR